MTGVNMQEAVTGDRKQEQCTYIYMHAGYHLNIIDSGSETTVALVSRRGAGERGSDVRSGGSSTKVTAVSFLMCPLWIL